MRLTPLRRHHGNVINTTSRLWLLNKALFVATLIGLLTLLMLLLGLTQRLDDESDAAVVATGRLAAAAHAHGVQAGREQMQEELAPGVLGAWQAGLAEGRAQCATELRAGLQ